MIGRYSRINLSVWLYLLGFVVTFRAKPCPDFVDLRMISFLVQDVYFPSQKWIAFKDFPSFILCYIVLGIDLFGQKKSSFSENNKFLLCYSKNIYMDNKALSYTRSDGMPSHGLFRVQSSHIMTPRLKMSHFSVKGSLRISSGAIHSGVPADEASLKFASVIILESPKSQILTVQCLFTRQLALLISRWTIFILCMHISPLIAPKVFSHFSCYDPSKYMPPYKSSST